MKRHKFDIRNMSDPSLFPKQYIGQTYELLSYEAS